MAVRNFLISKDAMVALESSSGDQLGAGLEGHLPVGVYTGAYTIRSLLQFTLDWTNVYQITSAVLKIKTSTGNNHGVKTTHNMYVKRNTSSWSEGTKGADESWYASNAVHWGNKPSTTSTGQATIAGSASDDVLRSHDLTDIVKAWAPTSIPGGGGLSNYGITIQQTTESAPRYNVFQSREGGVDAYIELTYVDTPPQTIPTVTKITPVSNGLSRIPNMDSVNSDSFTPNAFFQFEVDDAEQTIKRIRVRIYSAASGGSIVHEYDTGAGENLNIGGPFIAEYEAPDPAAGIGPTWHPVDGTSYWWTVEVWDNYSTPASSGETTRTEFRVRWGSVIFSRNVGSGATSLQATMTPSSPAANTQRKVLHRLADDSAGTGATAWVTSIGALPTPGASTDWVQTYVRLSSDLAGTNPQIDKYVLSYLAAGTQPFPDKWAVDVSPTKFALDGTIRRYGSRSLKGEAVSADTNIYPKRGIVGDEDIPVTPDTDYVLTWEVRTNGAPLAAGNALGILVYPAGMLTDPIAGGADNVEGPNVTVGTFDANGVPLFTDGWKRLILPFRTGPSTTRIRPALLYFHVAGSDTFWQDGAMLTEGTVAPPWAQGTVAAAGTVSASGTQLDGAQGAIFRYRGTTGGLRDTVEGGSSGLKFGGDTEVTSPAAGVVKVDNTAAVDQVFRLGDDADLFDADVADRLGVKGQQDAANGGIVFGSAKDTNIYRSAANELKTDDALAVGGAYISGATSPVVRVYTASATWNRPTGIHHIRIRGVGCGGGGAGADTTGAGQYSGGGGGGGGGYFEKVLSAAQLAGDATYDITIGTVGIAGDATGTGGGTGGNATFAGTGISTLTANGGGGGEGGAATAGFSIRAGGGGGTATNGDINVTGSDGSPAILNVARHALGNGGGSVLGGFTQAGGSDAGNAGIAGSQYGSGGSSAHNGVSVAGKAGGAGALGVIIVEEFYAP